MVIQGSRGQDRLDLYVYKHYVTIRPDGHLARERQGVRVLSRLTNSYLKCEGSTRRVFSLSHDGDITPLHCQPVGQAEDGDCGAVGPAGVQLERRRVSMVDVDSFR